MVCWYQKEHGRQTWEFLSMLIMCFIDNVENLSTTENKNIPNWLTPYNSFTLIYPFWYFRLLRIVELSKIHINSMNCIVRILFSKIGQHPVRALNTTRRDLWLAKCRLRSHICHCVLHMWLYIIIVHLMCNKLISSGEIVHLCSVQDIIEITIRLKSVTILLVFSVCVSHLPS